MSSQAHQEQTKPVHGETTSRFSTLKNALLVALVQHIVQRVVFMATLRINFILTLITAKAAQYAPKFAQSNALKWSWR
jgi:hypothetical protein